MSLVISLLAAVNFHIPHGCGVSAFVLNRRAGEHGITTTTRSYVSPSPRLRPLSASSPSQEEKGDGSTPILKAPTFNGQLILPIKVVLNGLKGHNKVAAVYAIQPRKQNGYSAVTYISITKDLLTDLQSLTEKYPGQIEYIRALSFSYPQKAAMQDVAQRWEAMVLQEGGKLGLEEGSQVRDKGMSMDENYYDEDDDDDDDDEFEWDDADTVKPADLFVDETKKTQTTPSSSSSSKSTAQIISPFQENSSTSSSSISNSINGDNDADDEKLVFNRESVDKVLDEIRPYLISDGGNVSVHSIDEKTKSVYLTLEGACGSCASSTVTMQMGIERILREKFDNLGSVEQVQPSDMVEGEGDGGVSTKKGLTMEAVMKEINRIGPAISAMGGLVEVLTVDEELGVVEVRFRGANKVQQGLELALRDVPYVKHVKFVN